MGYYQIEEVQSTSGPEWFQIEGLVENPINLTYAELWNFPLVSEVTRLECVGGGTGGYGITYNWTGVPLFYLLGMAKVTPGDYREVVFKATDNFSSSILLETAMHPTTILALEANGTNLETILGFGGGYRVAVPCRWGYKWVKWIDQIVVVDYDYKGHYEQVGFSDEAIMPNCTLPSTTPPVRTFNVTELDECAVQVLSNSSIDYFDFDLDGRMTFNVTDSENTSGYFYITFPSNLMTYPYQVYIDDNRVEHQMTNASSNVYICFMYSHSAHEIRIEGTRPVYARMPLFSRGDSP
ncbi:MAG: molybdopterin-dependent oxidoreductase [Candidatus Bathyarchaeota archaeon]|nr:molybdopterin-dependent oxidoreductase [Candidatus Bathyarchaeota archaeon]MDH5788078.1 molybdopterin-dependent oxidoreductase [Candidatus Bathyarchaeota archaeon]